MPPKVITQLLCLIRRITIDEKILDRLHFDSQYMVICLSQYKSVLRFKFIAATSAVFLRARLLEYPLGRRQHIFFSY